MSKTFRDAFVEAIATTGRKIKHVAAEADVSYEMLKKLHQGASKSINVDDAVKVAHHFGVTLDEFLADTTVQDRAEALALWRKLTAAERDLLQAAARGQRDVDLEEEKL